MEVPYCHIDPVFATKLCPHFCENCLVAFMGWLFNTPFQKVTQHDFDRLYFFYHGFLFIKFDISRKPVYLPFD